IYMASATAKISILFSHSHTAAPPLPRALPTFITLAGATHGDLHAERLGHCRFGHQCSVGRLRVVGISDLYVVALVAGHHLVARYAIGHRVHDGPLRRCLLPAALGLFQRKVDDLGTSD